MNVVNHINNLSISYIITYDVYLCVIVAIIGHTSLYDAHYKT